MSRSLGDSKKPGLAELAHELLVRSGRLEKGAGVPVVEKTRCFDELEELVQESLASLLPAESPAKPQAPRVFRPSGESESDVSALGSLPKRKPGTASQMNPVEEALLSIGEGLSRQGRKSRAVRPGNPDDFRWQEPPQVDATVKRSSRFRRTLHGVSPVLSPKSK